MVASGGADVLLALEPAEALRFAHFLSPVGGRAGKYQTGLASYSDLRPGRVPASARDPSSPKSAMLQVVAMDATALAETAGIAVAMNVVMLGALAGYIPLSEEIIMQALFASVVPPKFLEASKKAFALGKAEVE